MFTASTSRRRPLFGLVALLCLGGCKARLEVDTDHPLFPWDESTATSDWPGATESPGPQDSDSVDTTVPVDTTGPSATQPDAGEMSTDNETLADAGPAFPEPDVAWGPEMIVNARDVDARDLQVAMDAAGNTLFVWRVAGPYDTFDGVYWRYYSRTSGWSAIERLATDFEITADLRVCGNADGSAVVTWTSTRTPSSQTPRSLWVAYHSADVGMFDPVELQENTVIGSAGCGIDASGEGMVVWSTESALVFSRGAETNWAEPEVIASESAPSQRLAMNSQGNAVVVARAGSADAYSFLGVWYDASSGWSESRAVPLPAQSAEAPDLPPFAVALGGDDTAHLVWTQAAAYDRLSEVWTSTFTTEAGWSAPLQLTDQGTRGSGVVTVSADDVGLALALWTGDDSESSRVQGRRFLPGVGWESNDLLDEEGGPLPFWISSSMSAAFGSDGSALVAFRRTYGNADSALAILSVSPVGTVDPFLTQRRGYTNMNPAVAINAAGQAVVAWESFENTSQAFVIFRDKRQE